MFTDNRYIKIISRGFLIGIYVSFFSVQLNLHVGDAPVVSFFTGDFISQQSIHTDHVVLSKDHHKDAKCNGFRLNKRFHPSDLFMAPDVLQDLVKYNFRIQTALLNESQPLASFSFNSPSLRGPPTPVV